MSVRPVAGGPVDATRVPIGWWGAAPRSPLGERRRELDHLDGESEGGPFPASWMNRTVTACLVRHDESVRGFLADGGPPELRSP